MSMFSYIYLMLLFIFVSSIYMKSRSIKLYEYKNLNYKFTCSLSPYNQSRPNHVCEFCLVNILTFSKWCATTILVYRYKLFNYKYVHIVMTNALNLNKKKYFYFYFLTFLWIPHIYFFQHCKSSQSSL